MIFRGELGFSNELLSIGSASLTQNLKNKKSNMENANLKSISVIFKLSGIEAKFLRIYFYMLQLILCRKSFPNLH